MIQGLRALSSLGEKGEDESAESMLKWPLQTMHEGLLNPLRHHEISRYYQSISKARLKALENLIMPHTPRPPLGGLWALDERLTL